jgi:hypothetical protein
MFLPSPQKKMIYQADATVDIPNVDLLTLLFGMVDPDLNIWLPAFADFYRIERVAQKGR